MTFEESQRYLLSIGNEVSSMKLGLTNIRTLLTALNDPQNNYLKVQVAGTNGKGSVCAFLDSICNTAGISVGTFTSPHLVSITERIRIKGVDISGDDFARHATLVRERSENLLAKGVLAYLPTFFEQITAIALVAFADAKVELAILETGLGGRLDATTAANAEIAAITRIDLDHQEYLGETLAEIAAEKAGMIRSDSKVIVGGQQRIAEQVIRGRCRELGIEPTFATTNLITKNYDDEPSYPIRSTSFKTEQGNYPDIVLGLQGKHQEENAALAIGIVEILRDFGFEISDDHVSSGLQNGYHPGRLERDGIFLFDGAHNEAGAKALGEYLDEFVEEPLVIVFGAMKGKNVAEMADILFPRAEKLILTQPSNSRAMSADEVAQFVPDDFEQEDFILTNTVKEALYRAKQLSNDGTILVTGSLYLVGEVKKLLKEENGI